MRKGAITLLLAEVLTTCALASQLIPFELSDLSSKSELIVVARVIAVTPVAIDSRKPTPLDQVLLTIGSVLKGDPKTNHLAIVLEPRGVRGFDPAVKAGDSGVFFLSRYGNHLRPCTFGAVALFEHKNFVATENTSDAWSQEAAAKPYLAYWVTNQALGEHVEYVDLILTRKPLAELPGFSQPTNQPIPDSDAIIAVTYARDSIWNVDLRPFKPLTGVEVVGTNFIVIRGEKFAWIQADLGEVLRLLQNPMGKIRIHRMLTAVDGQEMEVRILAAQLEQQLARKEANQPAAPPVPAPTSTNAHAKTIPQDIFEQIGRQLPKLNCLGTSSGTSSSSEVWKGEEYATAHYGNESDAFALSITIHRYPSTDAAQEDLKKGFGMRPALPPRRETYKSARLYRYASGGNAICQFNQYIIEVTPGPRSGLTQSAVMKALDAALAGLRN